MKILVLDTSTLEGTVGLVHHDEVMAEERRVGHERGHASDLPCIVERLLEKAHWQTRDLQGIVVAIGPGSFTGLRVGLGFSKGMALALSIPIVGISSLAILAANRPLAETIVVPMIDARRGEIYGSAVRYRSSGDRVMTEIGDIALSPEEWVKRLKGLKGSVWLGGNGALRYQSVLSQGLGKRISFAKAEDHFPHARAIAQLGRDWLDKGGDDLASLHPTYIRVSDAEIGFAEGKAR